MLRRTKGLPESARATWPIADVQTCVDLVAFGDALDLQEALGRGVPEAARDPRRPTVEAAQDRLAELAETCRDRFPAPVWVVVPGPGVRRLLGSGHVTSKRGDAGRAGSSTGRASGLITAAGGRTFSEIGLPTASLSSAGPRSVRSTTRPCGGMSPALDCMKETHVEPNTRGRTRCRKRLVRRCVGSRERLRPLRPDPG